MPELHFNGLERELGSGLEIIDVKLDLLTAALNGVQEDLHITADLVHLCHLREQDVDVLVDHLERPHCLMDDALVCEPDAFVVLADRL